MNAINSMAAFGDNTAIWYEAAIKGVGALTLASCFWAFLTPKAHKRLFAACLIGAMYFISDYVVRYLTESQINAPLIMALRTIVVSALVFGISCLIYERELGKQAFLLCSFSAVSSISVLLVISINHLFPLFSWIFGYISAIPSISDERLILYIKIGMAASYVYNAAIYSALLYFPIRGIIQSFTYKKRKLRAAETAALILPCMPVFILIYAVRVFIADADEFWIFGLQSLNESYSVLVFLSCICLLFTLIASVRMTQKSIGLQIGEKNAAILREQIREMQKRDTGGMYAEIRGIRHDMKNHLSNMRFLLKAAGKDGSDSVSELNNYLGKMNETLERFEFAFQTGNAVTDAVIHAHYLDARRKSIKFTSEFLYPVSRNIDAYDLAVILQNALDNAVEACEHVPEAERFISLRSRTKGEAFFVEISNSYAGAIAFDEQTGLPLTCKPDAGTHGLGVDNIKRSAEKYRGGIDILLSERIFTLTIILQGTTA